MLGYQRDEASRLWVRARNLDVVKGRYVSRDPLWIHGLLVNAYRYVKNGPINLQDPSGEEIKPTCPFYLEGPGIDYSVWPFYGCFCGPQTFVPQIPLFGSPMDAIDQCCEAHDHCFEVNHCPPQTVMNPFASPACVACDSVLCTCSRMAAGGGCSGSPTAGLCYSTAWTIASAFCCIFE
jgi:RHS repeat-associated protein